VAIIDPVGFLCGERIGNCSDEAQYHWPRLVAASNSYGRIKLDYEFIVETVYRSIRKKPSPEKLAEFLMDYRDNWLLFVYTTDAGETWGEWLIPDHLQRNYHTAADRRTPAPDLEAKEAYRQKYLESVREKKTKSNRFNDIFKPLLKTEILNTSSEISQSIARVGLGREGMDRDGNTKTSTTTPQASSTRGTRIPASFAVTEEHRRWARDHLYTSPDLIIDEFRDYWIGVPGSRGCKLDWDATFRNRIREKTKPGGNHAASGGSGVNRAQARTDGNIEAAKRALESLYGNDDSACGEAQGDVIECNPSGLLNHAGAIRPEGSERGS
jgi:hypothetical protein